MSAQKLTPEEVLGLAAALGFWGKMGESATKTREDFSNPARGGPDLSAAWAAAAHEACSMAAILRAEAQAAVNERKRAAVEPGDGIVEDDYTGEESSAVSQGLAAAGDLAFCPVCRTCGERGTLCNVCAEQVRVAECSKLVCAICGADAVLDEEGAYRHAKRPFEDQSMFCDRQGYPVKVRLVQVQPSHEGVP